MSYIYIYGIYVCIYAYIYWVIVYRICPRKNNKILLKQIVCLVQIIVLKTTGQFWWQHWGVQRKIDGTGYDKISEHFLCLVVSLYLYLCHGRKLYIYVHTYLIIGINIPAVYIEL